MCQSSCQQTSRQLQTKCGRASHTRPTGPSETPDGVDPNIKRTRKTQRDGHNSGVKVWSVCSVSSILSHANLWTTLSNLAIKGEVNIFLKKSFCVFFLASFLPASSFLRLCPCVCLIIVSLWCCRWLYNIVRFGACASRVLQGFKTNLVTVNDNFKHHNTTSTKRDKEKCWNWKK